MTFVLKKLVQKQKTNDRLRNLRLQATEQQQQQQEQQQQSQQPLPVVATIPLQPSSTVTASILLRPSQEVMRRPHNRHIHFSTTRDTTCVYPRGIALPLAVQKTFVFNGASILRDPTNRPALLARYGRISQTHYARTRRVGFGPAVVFTGRVTLEPLLEMPIGILQPILEEEEAEAGLVHLEPELGVEDMEVEPIREEDSTVDATCRPIKRRRSDEGLAPEEKISKRVCLRAEISSQVHRHGIKRKWSGSALEHNKRACIRADDSHVKSQAQVVETLSTTETEAVVEDISFEPADDHIVEDDLAEEAPTELVVREEVEATPPAPLQREVAALQSSLGPYWEPRRSSRVRKRPDRFVPSF